MSSNTCLAYKEIFDAYLARSLKPLSCYHFSSIFAWKDFFEFSFEVIDDRLCVFAHQGKDCFLYLPPLGGDLKASTITECFKRMGSSRIARIENICDNQLPMFKSNGYNEYLKAHEYLYRRKDLADLAGHAYKSKRHDIHVFAEHCPKAQFRAYGPSDLEGCKDLYRRWSIHRKEHHDDPVYLAMLEDNLHVHPLLIANVEALGLTGRVLVNEGEIVGYTFGYALDAQTFCVLLEVTDLTQTGSAAYIFNRFCMDPSVADFEFINTMDDFGLPNVAVTKQSYHPCKVLPQYTISKARL